MSHVPDEENQIHDKSELSPFAPRYVESTTYSTILNPSSSYSSRSFEDDDDDDDNQFHPGSPPDFPHQESSPDFLSSHYSPVEHPLFVDITHHDDNSILLGDHRSDSANALSFALAPASAASAAPSRSNMSRSEWEFSVAPNVDQIVPRHRYEVMKLWEIKSVVFLLYSAMIFATIYTIVFVIIVRNDIEQARAVHRFIYGERWAMSSIYFISLLFSLLYMFIIFRLPKAERTQEQIWTIILLSAAFFGQSPFSFDDIYGLHKKNIFTSPNAPSGPPTTPSLPTVNFFYILDDSAYTAATYFFLLTAAHSYRILDRTKTYKLDFYFPKVLLLSIYVSWKIYVCWKASITLGFVPFVRIFPMWILLRAGRYSFFDIFAIIVMTLMDLFFAVWIYREIIRTTQFLASKPYIDHRYKQLGFKIFVYLLVSFSFSMFAISLILTLGLPTDYYLFVYDMTGHFITAPDIGKFGLCLVYFVWSALIAWVNLPPHPFKTLKGNYDDERVATAAAAFAHSGIKTSADHSQSDVSSVSGSDYTGSSTYRYNFTNQNLPQPNSVENLTLYRHREFRKGTKKQKLVQSKNIFVMETQVMMLNISWLASAIGNKYEDVVYAAPDDQYNNNGSICTTTTSNTRQNTATTSSSTQISPRSPSSSATSTHKHIEDTDASLLVDPYEMCSNGYSIYRYIYDSQTDGHLVVMLRYDRVVIGFSGTRGMKNWIKNLEIFRARWVDFFNEFEYVPFSTRSNKDNSKSTKSSKAGMSTTDSTTCMTLPSSSNLPHEKRQRQPPVDVADDILFEYKDERELLKKESNPSGIVAALANELITFGQAKIHSGFAHMYKRLRPRLMATLMDLYSSEAKGMPIFFTGHSLGGALATLAAFDASLHHKRLGIRKRSDISCTTFGCPKVGNDIFAKNFDAKVAPHWRFVLASDVITKMPRYTNYEHCGTQVLLDYSGNLLVNPSFVEVRWWHDPYHSTTLHSRVHYYLALKAWCRYYRPSDSLDTMFWPWPYKDSQRLAFLEAEPNALV